MNEKEQLDEETLARRKAIAKVRMKRKTTVAKVLNWIKAIILIALIIFVLSFIFFPGWMTFAKEGNLDQYASSQGLNPKLDTAVSAAEEGKAPEKEPEPALPPEPVYETVSIRCIGYIMAHQAQVEGAYDSATDTYDFSGHFQYVAPYVAAADLTIANVETTFKGSGPYKGYPSFNAPDVLAANIRDMGVDVGLLANNHIMDQGLSVLERSIDHLRENGMDVAGCQHAGEKRYLIEDVKGVKVGIVAYTYETPRNGGKRTINAAVLSSEAEEVINSFTQDSYEVLAKDLEVIRTRIEECRADGAEVMVVYMHWGEEYQKAGNPFQHYMADYLANNGADIVFGSHAHVPQDIELVEGKDAQGNPKTVPVFYCMGNFVSNQRSETLTGTYGAAAATRTEQELIACIDLTFNMTDRTFVIDRTSFIPLWVDREKLSSGKYNYGVIPLTEGFENNEMLVRTGHVKRAQDALAAMTALIGEEFLNTEPIQ